MCRTNNIMKKTPQDQIEESHINQSNHSNSDDHELHIDWDIFEKFLISEAAFAIATVLTFLALLHDAVILEFVGPLLLSFVGMIRDIARFLLIFVFVWVSFGIGFTQLYRTFEELEEAACTIDTDEEHDSSCQSPPFSS